MKKSLLFIILSLSCLWGIGQNISVQANCDTAYLTLFGDISKQLTITHLNSVNSPFKDSVSVPASEYMPIATELTSIYLTSNTILAADSIFNIYSSDNIPYSRINKVVPHIISSLHTISINIDTTHSWAANLARGIIPTGNNTIDYLISRYGLSPQNVSATTASPSILYLELYSPIGLNMTAFTSQFYNIPGITFAHVYPSYGGFGHSNTIRSDSISYINYLFNYSFGDCNPDCDKHHYWLFRVSPECLVECDSSYGSSLYTNTGINLMPLADVSIHPIPATDRLILSIPLTDFTISISDITGRAYALPLLEREIDISSLANGVYFLHIQSRDGSVVRRFVKN